MIKKTPFIVMIAGLVTALAIIISGCSTEKPWTTNPNVPLTLSLVSGPSDSLEVEAFSNVSFSWKSTGGAGEPTYRNRLNGGDWSTPTNVTIVTFTALDEGVYTFEVQAQDAAGQTASASSVFRVLAFIPPPVDTIPPVVALVTAPQESSFVATGSVVAFAWEGTDNLDGEVLYQYSFAGVTSGWIPTRTVTFTDVAVADPAIFTVSAKDAAGNISEAASITFFIKNASVLYVDDYEWLDSFGNVDRAKEREQKAFYREALRGYAFAEWDIASQGMPDSSFITGFTTVVFASDSHLGDSSPTWWYDVGDVGGGVMAYYMENGGHLIAIGANILQWIYNSNPPAPGDFEYDWFGIDSTDGWDYWGDFTWAINAENIAGLPDSMKIDVAKNGDQVDIAEDIFAFRDSAVVLYTKGLDVDGGEPEDYGVSVGHIFYPGGGAARAAMLNFDGFSMPLPGMRETIHTVLNQFGEGTGF